MKTIRDFIKLINEAQGEVATSDAYKYVADGTEYILTFTSKYAKEYTDLVFQYGFGSHPEKVEVTGEHHSKVPEDIFQRSQVFDSLLFAIDTKEPDSTKHEIAKNFYQLRLAERLKDYTISKKFIVGAEHMTEADEFLAGDLDHAHQIVNKLDDVVSIIEDGKADYGNIFGYEAIEKLKEAIYDIIHNEEAIKQIDAHLKKK